MLPLHKLYVLHFVKMRDCCDFPFCPGAVESNLTRYEIHDKTREISRLRDVIASLQSTLDKLYNENRDLWRIVQSRTKETDVRKGGWTTTC